MDSGNLSEARSYRVGEVLGRGGFGTVYLAEMVGKGGFTKQVALKVLNAEVGGQTAHLARLRDEARILGRLHHRAIVAVDGLVRLDGRWSIVMEYVRGATLKEILDRSGRIPLGVALQICEEVAAALHVAHAAPQPDGQPLRLLHRDIKPNNIQVTPAGDVKLLDFGVARAEFDARESTSRSVVYGSVPYMAPERLEFQDGHGADVYALAVTLLELISGRLPGKPTSREEPHERRIEEGLAKLGDEDPELLELLRRTLAHDPETRLDARALQRDIRALRRKHEDQDLSEWAEEVVPAVLGVKTLVEDDLSGTLLVEDDASGSVVGTLAGLAAAPTFDEVETFDPAPEAAPAQAPPQPRRRRSTGNRVATAVSALFASGVLLIGVAALLLVLMVGGGVTLVTAGMALLWPPMTRGVCAQEFAKMQEQLHDEARPSSARARMDRVLTRGAGKCDSGTISVMETVTLEHRLDGCTADGVISDGEVSIMAQLIERLARD